MPYVLLRKNGKPVGFSDLVWLEHELENLENKSDRKTVYTFVNVVTRRIRKVRGVK